MARMRWLLHFNRDTHDVGNSFPIQERLKTQSGEENSSSGCFNPVGRL